MHLIRAINVRQTLNCHHFSNGEYGGRSPPCGPDEWGDPLNQEHEIGHWECFAFEKPQNAVVKSQRRDK